MTRRPTRGVPLNPDPPGSRADAADLARAEQRWQDFCARIDAPGAAR